MKTLQDQIDKIKVDHGIQISKLNTQLTSHLTEKTRLAEQSSKMAEQFIDLKVKVEILDKQNDEIVEAMGELKKYKPANDSAPFIELVET